MTGMRIGKTLYKLIISPHQVNTTSLKASCSAVDLNTWHERLAHTNGTIIKQMANGNCVSGMIVTQTKEKLAEYCHGCILGKMHKLPFTKSTSKTDHVGELIHSDVVGPMQVPSPNGVRYYVLFKDDFSRYKAVYFIKQKSETAECLKSFTKK